MLVGVLPEFMVTVLKDGDSRSQGVFRHLRWVVTVRGIWCGRLQE